MAAWWFPANDHPLDKAQVDVRVQVPAGKQVVSNGTRVGVKRHHDGRKTVHWRSDEPMAPYLAFFAAGDFAVERGVARGLPWYAAVSRALPDAQRQVSMRLLRRSPRVVRWLEQRLGRYPFTSTGGLVTSLAPGFALENQTRPTYPALHSGSMPLVVHELAHQWFGNSVSVAQWRDIWLNEGPATFLEAAWAEDHGGPTAQAWLESSYDAYPADADFWRLDLSDPGPDRLFAWPVYLRGGMALQALRNRVGEADFWTILRTWLASRSDGNGSGVEFEQLAATVSGEDLGDFFDAWLRAPERPARTAELGLSPARVRVSAAAPTGR
jgi:aminopeptidase N